MPALIQSLFGLSLWTWFGINVVVTLLMVGWVYNDSRARQASPYPWIAAMFFLSAPIGLMAYLFARPKGTTVKCWSCGRLKMERLVTCPWCGTRPSPETEKAAAAAAQHVFSRLAKENFEAIVIAFAFALIIRCFFIEVFKIPSSSMEPTLQGDVTGPEGNHPLSGCPFPDQHVAVGGGGMTGGDRIMVTKYYYGLTPVERYDVIVFKFPLNIAKNFIKRVVGLPDEYVMVKYGNIWTSKEPTGKFAIARKPLRIQDTLWIDMNHEIEQYCPTHGAQDRDSCRECGRPLSARPRAMLKDAASFGEHWSVKDPDHQAGFEVKDGNLRILEQDGRKSIMFEYRGPLVDYPGRADVGVDDLRLRFRFELNGREGAIVARMEHRYGVYDVKLSASEGSRLLYTDATGKRQEIPLKIGRLETDRAHAFELFTYDGMVYVRVDGAVAVEHEYMRYHDEARALRWTDDGDGQSRVVQFGVRDGLATFSHLALERDVHYKLRSGQDDTFRDGEAIHIPPDHYLVMGDNTQFSHDSRAWRKVWYKLKDGRTIVAEREARKSESSYRDKYKDADGRKPDFVIASDEHGNEVPIWRKDVVDSDDDGKPFRYVGAEYIVGKALWIWWPLQRVGLIK